MPEFYEFASPGDHADDGTHVAEEELSVGRPPSRRGRVLLICVLAVAAVLVGLVVTQHLTTGRHTAAPTPTGQRPSTPPAPSATSTPPDDYPEGPLKRAEILACAGSTQCTVGNGDAAGLRAARRALGSAVSVQVRTVRPRPALIVTAVGSDGARLFVLVTGPAQTIDGTALGIRPPVGITEETTSSFRLVTVASGTEKSIALLSRPAVQAWLATLRPG